MPPGSRSVLTLAHPVELSGCGVSIGIFAGPVQAFLANVTVLPGRVAGGKPLTATPTLAMKVMLAPSTGVGLSDWSASVTVGIESTRWFAVPLLGSKVAVPW
ncbi:MAG: hypothetical protein L0271_07270 [Gemmatimonadetes bacterium]|nr:hypothetical protein [Gemmatimonadota bacterium]